MSRDGDLFDRIETLERDYNEMKEVLVGDVKNPGGVLSEFKLMREDLKDVKATTKRLFTVLSTAISISVSLGVLVGKYFFK